MKKFLSVQIIIILVGYFICFLIRCNMESCSYLNVNSYDKLKQIDAAVYMIPEEDAWLNQSAESYINFFENLYVNVKTKFFDKQVLIIEASDELEVYNNCIFQNVKVISVIDGDKDIEGHIFEFIYPSGFYIETRQEYNDRILYNQQFGIEDRANYDERPILHLAGINIMKPNHRYLLFGQSTKLDSDYTVLCADKHQYTWMDMSDSYSRAMRENSYQGYFDNEIFTSSQTVIDDYYRLKSEVFEYYGIET